MDISELPLKYWLEKRFWSQKADAVPGYQPYIWRKVNFQILNFPKSRVAFKAMVRRIGNMHGSGRYIIYREQFEGEKPMFRPVVYFQIRDDGKYRVIKKYSQFTATPTKPDSFLKQHEKRILVTVDIKERTRARRRALLERMKHEVKRPKPFKHTIRTNTGLWKYETKG
jgi:hypothetical protein